MSGLSVVMPSRDEGRRVGATVRALLPGLPHDGELLVVDDASSDGSTDGLAAIDPRVRVHRSPRRLGPAVARNVGAMLTVGDLLVFVDAHVDPLGPWAGPLRSMTGPRRVGAVSPALEDWTGGSRGYGLRLVDVATNVGWLERRGRQPYDVPLLPGFFLAVRRDVFVSVGGFDETYARWGMEDLDLVVRLWTLGFECLVAPDIVVRHWSKHAQPPDYQQDWSGNLFNILVFGATHYGEQRWRQLAECYGDQPALPGLLDRIASDGVRERRSRLRVVRARDDDDLFAACGCG